MVRSSTELVLGVDGGGTALKGCLLTTAGELLSSLKAPAANYAKLRERLLVPITDLLHQMERLAGVTQDSIEVAGVCSTGIGRSSDREIIRKALTQAGIAKRIWVDSDAAAALSGAFAGQPGIIVIAGTGAVAYARTSDGSLIRTGGWGHRLGDEGSGYALARNALNAALKAWDGRGQQTELVSKFEQFFEVDRIDSIVEKVYSPQFDRGDMARLAPLVFQCADEGDPVAGALVRQAGTEIGELIRPILARFDPTQSTPVSFLGGLFNRADLLMPAVWNTLGKLREQLRPVEPRYSAAIGAGLLALQKFDFQLDDYFFDRLDETIADVSVNPA